MRSISEADVQISVSQTVNLLFSLLANHSGAEGLQQGGRLRESQRWQVNTVRKEKQRIQMPWRSVGSGLKTLAPLVMENEN